VTVVLRTVADDATAAPFSATPCLSDGIAPGRGDRFRAACHIPSTFDSEHETVILRGGRSQGGRLSAGGGHGWATRGARARPNVTSAMRVG